jgi:acyl transferase domain-containing protein
VHGRVVTPSTWRARLALTRARAGTPLGDPIEVGALRHALAAPLRAGAAPQPAALLSNKSCFGHTEGAAGLTGLLLAAMAAAHAAPPVRHLRVVNPYVEAALGDWRARGGRAPALPRQAAPRGWALGGRAGRWAATSSFGMSGVNAHALVAPAPLPAAARSQVPGPAKLQAEHMRRVGGDE